MTTEGARPGCHTGKSGGILLAATSAQVGGRMALRELFGGILGRGFSAGALRGLFEGNLGWGFSAGGLAGWVVE